MKMKNESGAAVAKEETVLYKEAQKALKDAMKELRMESGAVITKSEIVGLKNKVARKMLRAESGAAIGKDELKAFKKATGLKRGGAVKNK